MYGINMPINKQYSQDMASYLNEHQTERHILILLKDRLLSIHTLMLGILS